MTLTKRPWIVALALAACCFSTLAFAELTPVDPETRRDILFQVLGEIARRVTGWEAQVTSAASYLFWTLGTISLTWTMGMMILKRADLGEFFAEFIRFIFFFGLFFALLRQGPEVAKLILQSMLQLGQQTAGSTIEYRTFIDIGMELMSRADQFQQTGASREDSFLVTGLCAAILLMLTTMVINLVLVFVAGWFLMYAGIFFLGFGGARWTSDIAIGYYKAVIAIGIQMFVMALIMGIATDVLGGFFDKFSFEMRFYELMTFLVATFAFLTIFNRIPSLLSGLISGANIGISQGELSGAVRGANGADPFGAGRLAIGTAAGGAQKLFAAMARGLPDGRIQSTDSLMSLPDSKDKPSSFTAERGSRVAQAGSVDSVQSLGRGGATGALGVGGEGQRPAAMQGIGGINSGGSGGRNEPSMLGGAGGERNATSGTSARFAATDRRTESTSSVSGQPAPAAAPQTNAPAAGPIEGASSAPTMVAQTAPTNTATPSGTESSKVDPPASEPLREDNSNPREVRVAHLEGAASRVPESETTQSFRA